MPTMTDNDRQLPIIGARHLDALHEVIRLNPYPHIDRRLLIDIEMYLRATLMAEEPYVTPPHIVTWAETSNQPFSAWDLRQEYPPLSAEECWDCDQ